MATTKTGITTVQFEEMFHEAWKRAFCPRYQQEMEFKREAENSLNRVWRSGWEQETTQKLEQLFD